jgi:hypothetical protein
MPTGVSGVIPAPDVLGRVATTRPPGLLAYSCTEALGLR